MKKYETPTSEVIVIESTDIIRTSPDTPIIDADGFLDIE